MKTRLLLAGVVLLIAAFAPAPFPRPNRPARGAVTVAQIVGTWTILKLESPNGTGGMIDQGDYLSEVRVANGRWSFVYRNPGQKPPVVYQLTIDASKSPAHIDLTRPGETSPYGTGIITRKGDTMRMLYSFGQPRPTSFTRPAAGYWHLTMQRKR